MTMEDHFHSYGLYVDEEAASHIRQILEEQILLETESQGAGDTTLMRLCCVQLFNLAQKEDITRIWRAKTSSMDSDCSIDVHLLCGRGLEETIVYLESEIGESAKSALKRILEYRNLGFFEAFSVKEYMQECDEYYRV